MFNPMSQLNYFFRLATERKLSGSDQLMYLHIFNKFNQAHWTETLRIKDAELKDLLRLYDTTGKPASIDVIRRGRQRLKAKGFIDFKSCDGYEPEYRLPCLYPADTPADSPADSLASSYIRTREDVKDVKILNDYTNACAKAEEIDELLEYWEHAGGCKLNQLLVSKLNVLLKASGLSAIKAAIDKANDGANSSHYGFSLDYVKSKLLKGGDNNDRKILSSANKTGRREPTRIEYKKPVYTVEDYAKFFGIHSAEEYEKAGLGSADDYRKLPRKNA